MKMNLFIHLLLAKVVLLLLPVIQMVLQQTFISDLNLIHTLTLNQATIHHQLRWVLNQTDYTINIPSTDGDSFSSFLLYVTTTDVAVTLSNVVVNTSDYSGPVDIVSVWIQIQQIINAAATEQGYDQWGNLICICFM